MSGPISVVLVERIADSEVLDRRLHQGEEVVEDALFDKDARAGAAVLPGVAEDGDGGLARGPLQVGVGEDDVGGLAAKLQRHPLYGARGAFRDPLPHLGRAGEGHLRDVGVLDEAPPDLAPGTDEDVDDAVWYAGLPGYALELDRREGRELGRLEDEGVAGRERGGHLPARYGKREVPGHYKPDDAERLAEGHVHAAGDGDRVAEEPLRHPGVVVEGLRHHPHLAERVADRLAGVLRLQLGQMLSFSASSASARRLRRRERSAGSTSRHAGKASFAREIAASASSSVAWSSLSTTSSVAGFKYFEHLGDLRN